MAPRGFCGVQVVANAGHSKGFFKPCNICPAMQAGDSRGLICPTGNRDSASKSENSGLKHHPLSGMIPMPRHLRSHSIKT